MLYKGKNKHSREELEGYIENLREVIFDSELRLKEKSVSGTI
jgi:hypothetical protein